MIKSLFVPYKGMDRNIWIRFIGETINGIAFMMLMPFLALYLKDQVDSLAHVGIVMAISPLAATFGSLVGGQLSDIYGRKPIMILSMVGNGIVMLGFILFDSFTGYLILSGFFGLFNSLFHPAASAMVADVTPPEHRTEAFGLLRMGNNIGAAVGPLLGASIVFLSKTIIFMVAASSVFIYSIILMLFIRETLPKRERKHSLGEVKPVKKDGLPSPFKVLFQDKLLFLFIMTGIVISMGFSQTEGMLPLHFDHEMPHFSDALNPYPYLMAFNGLLVVLFQFPISRWAQGRAIGKVMLYGAACFGFGLLAVGWLPMLFYQAQLSFPAVLIILLIMYGIYTLGEMLMSPVQMTFVSNLAPEHLRGTYMGASSLQWILGGSLGPLLAGFLLERGMGNTLFTFLGFGSIIAGIVYLSLDRLVKESTPEIATNMEGSKVE